MLVPMACALSAPLSNLVCLLSCKQSEQQIQLCQVAPKVELSWRMTRRTCGRRACACCFLSSPTASGLLTCCSAPKRAAGNNQTCDMALRHVRMYNSQQIMQKLPLGRDCSTGPVMFPEAISHQLIQLPAVACSSPMLALFIRVYQVITSNVSDGVTLLPASFRCRALNRCSQLVTSYVKF
jgi:hypothetical protein